MDDEHVDGMAEALKAIALGEVDVDAVHMPTIRALLTALDKAGFTIRRRVAS